MVEDTASETAAPTPAPPTPDAGHWLARLGGLGGRTVLVLLALVVVVAAADRSRLLFDWSADHRFSLSASLTRLLRAQTEPVELVGIWPEELADAVRPIADGLRLMTLENTKVTTRHIDPILHQPLLAEFARRYREAASLSVYVVRGERAFKIPLSAGTRRVLQREIGGALVALADPHPPVVNLLQGHGELRPGGGDDDGADGLVRSLELAGFQVRPLDLARTPAIPADGVLVVAGPVGPLGKADVAAVAEHLDDGGAALVLADDRMPVDLAALLRRRGILMGPDLPPRMNNGMNADQFAAALVPNAVPWSEVIVSMHRHFVGQETGFPHHQLLLDRDLISPDHVATAQVAASGQSVLSPWTTAVSVLEPSHFEGDFGLRLAEAYAKLGTPPFQAAPLLWTAPGDCWKKSRAEPLIAPEQLAKMPSRILALAVVSQPTSTSVRQGRGARLVVWGSRQAASDRVLGQERFANAALLVDLVKWLADRESATDIPEAELAAFQVNASDQTMFWLMGILVAILPCACLGAAMLAWWERR
jgi:hypothetical protein